MKSEGVRELLESKAPGRWELYRKSAASVERTAGPDSRAEALRREEGWAARWWDPSFRFAAASTPGSLAAAIEQAQEVRAAPGEPLNWPSGAGGGDPGIEPETPPAPPDVFEDLSRLLAAESRGEALLDALSIRRVATVERVRNAGGLDVTWTSAWLDGLAGGVGRRGTRACESRIAFRWDAAPELSSLARRLTDRLTLPLSDRGTPIERGELLLDPSVSASLLAGLAPLFTGEIAAPWAGRTEWINPRVSVVDDASADAPYDGEGTRSRRIVLVQDGTLRSRLHDLVSARRAGEEPTGHGVRPSYRTPPARAPRRLFFEATSPASPLDLLSSVRRGLFASALTAPARLDLSRDRYELEFTGVALVAGHAQGPVAGARSRGRLTDLLRRIGGVSSDRTFFPMPYPIGAPTLWIERASFE